MSVQKILQYPDPFLRNICKEVSCIDKDVKEIIRDIKDTLSSSPGVGLSAPQIGKAVRVIAVDVSKEKGGRGLLILLNPVIISFGRKKLIREGCLSIPQYTANVVRAESIKIMGLDEEGRDVKLSSEGLEAIALQHEADHLDGVLFIDRVASIKADVFRRKGYKGDFPPVKKAGNR